MSCHDHGTWIQFPHRRLDHPEGKIRVVLAVMIHKIPDDQLDGGEDPVSSLFLRDHRCPFRGSPRPDLNRVPRPYEERALPGEATGAKRMYEQGRGSASINVQPQLPLKELNLEPPGPEPDALPIELSGIKDD